MRAHLCVCVIFHWLARHGFAKSAAGTGEGGQHEAAAEVRKLPEAATIPMTDDALLVFAMKYGTITNEARMHAVKLLFEASAGTVGKATLIGALLFFLVTAGPAAGLWMLGFTAKGIASGSIAATIQSTFPLISGGSLFAWAQSMGATGAFFFPKLGALGAGLGAWAAAGGSSLVVSSDWQLFGVLLEKNLFDDNLRRILAGK
eukprot:CAMPEP_0176106762 /NCGR_PEP_ID=MMETSP0120_2-20121206/53576_1 /TAXON_ID=160619 /ORGANISM="Kryptoperidinium foliaceum, Strain CCMP 1326" /LENGTH=202 /DNA_ID=CAMNT_0017440885 /DNA_START=83 /DNA_END=691 /DNA_ORIENTATION=-